MHRPAIVTSRIFPADMPRPRTRCADPPRAADGAVDRCQQIGRAYEASRLMLAALGRRRQPLD